MATVLRFENRAASTTVDLLGTDDIYRLQSHWRQTSPQEGKVTEVYRLVVDDTSVANVIADVQALEDLLEAAFDWHSDPLESDSTWLRFAADGETAKRALVYNYELTPIGGGGPLGREMAFDTVVGFDLVVTRHRFWEDVSATQETHASNLSIWGGEWDLTGTITGGRVDARISALRVTAPGGTDCDRLWAGIHYPRGNTAAFSGAVDLHAVFSVVAGNASLATGEAGETGTGHILVDFSAHGESMDYRTYWTLGNSADDYEGNWILLARYKLSGGSSGTVGIRASASVSTGAPSTSTAQQQLATQYVDSTDWDIVELGEVRLPPSGMRAALDAATGNFNNTQVALSASRIDGDHDLLLDSLVFIPADHHLILEGDVTTGGGVGYWYAFTNEDDSVEAYAMRNQPPIVLYGKLAVRGTDTWQYPHEGGYLVFAARQNSGAHDATDTIIPRIDVYKRWITYHD